MRHIIFITLILLFSQTCEAKEQWYYGRWVVDENLTIQVLKDSDQELNAGKFVDVLNGFVIEINEHYISFIKGNNVMKVEYTAYSQDEGIVKLKTKNKDMYFGRDKYGVFYLGKETIKENDRPVKITNIRIYLKPSNKALNSQPPAAGTPKSGAH